MIIVRKIQKEELPEANWISAAAFHQTVEDPEKLADEWADDPAEQWAAFSEDGKMVSRIVNHRYEAYIDGKCVKDSGIGSVSILYEYRGRGGVRSIFEKMLPESAENGGIISTLYPFKHAFYRKFGYETVCTANVYSFRPEVLSEYCFSGEAVPYKKGDLVSAYTAL